MRERARDAGQHVDVVNLDVVVEARPHPGQEQSESTHGAVGVVGGNLQCETPRSHLGFGLRHPARLRLDSNGLAHRRTVKNSIDLGVAVRKVGADRHLALTPEMDP